MTNDSSGGEQTGSAVRVLIATTNTGKLVEYRELLAGLPCVLLDLNEAGISGEVAETGTTFEENARLKAVTYARWSGLITLADDSGLEVDALGGEPGLLSARYGGPGLSDIDRYRLVLRRLQGVATAERSARFVCVIALAAPDGRVETVAGTVEGRIADQPRGDNGFGYDPIFLLPERGLTMGELPADEKNRISHRAHAAHQARSRLESWLQEPHR